jgi:hypothetical protein
MAIVDPRKTLRKSQIAGRKSELGNQKYRLTISDGRMAIEDLKERRSHD